MKKIFILFTMMLILPVQSYAGMRYKGEITPGAWLKGLTIKYKAGGEKYSSSLQIYFPADYKRGKSARTLIALHGYNGTMSDWERNTGIEALADKYKFVVVCPDMGKTLYELKFYPETKIKWNGIPGGIFIVKKLMKHIKKNFNLAASSSKTGIFGLSTGGRGALLLAAEYRSQFGAVAGLSGDYDPLLVKKDWLITSVYGEYDKFKKRWEKDASIIDRASKLKYMPVFLAHGDKDPVVPKWHSTGMAIRLKQVKGKYPRNSVTYIIKKHRAHNWKFWGIIIRDVMEFFDKELKE